MLMAAHPLKWSIKRGRFGTRELVINMGCAIWIRNSCLQYSRGVGAGCNFGKYFNFDLLP